MGFPLRSNIFRTGSHEQEYFRKFPIQVAVLYSPGDQEFSEHFRDVFLHLDQLTGDHVAFFAVLDPPADWLRVAAEREWWQTYKQRIGLSGFSFQERPLVMELARSFDVTWHELPVLIVGTDLWTAERAVTSTSPWHLERQLGALTQLAEEWGQPTMGQIIQLLEDDFGADVRYRPSSDDLRYRLNQFYGVLDTYNPQRQFDQRGYRAYLARALDDIGLSRNILNRARHYVQGTDRELSENRPFDYLAGDVAGRLVPSATVAVRVLERLRLDREIPLRDKLNEESIAFIETALNVGNLLENLVDNGLYGLAPLRLREQSRDQMSGRWLRDLDFSAGAQGAWKALELETNLSIIQAARAARGIRMPEHYTLYVVGFPIENSQVKTGPGNRSNLNARDPRTRERHEFLMLGKGWHVVNTMLCNPSEKLDGILRAALGQRLPDAVLGDWQTVYELRNKASHISPLDRREYEQILNLALSPDLLAPLMRIKDHVLCGLVGEAVV
jgi:hypothetical protein